MTASQYTAGLNRGVEICSPTAARNTTKNRTVLARYPTPIDIDTASPPVSPMVVARIFVIQKPSVTAGSLAAVPAATRGVLACIDAVRRIEALRSIAMARMERLLRPIWHRGRHFRFEVPLS